jgi:hypothetical protein
MRSKSLPTEIAYWGSVGGLGFGLLERIALLVQTSPWLKAFAGLWQFPATARAESTSAHTEHSGCEAHARHIPS